MKRKIRNILKWTFIIFSIWFCGHVFYLVYDGLQKPSLQADVAMILGNKVNEDGSLSERLEKRMEVGLNLYFEKKVNKIIVSGGLGKEGHYEGDKMHDYLLKNGVPNSAIIVDNLGNNTELTVKNVTEINKEVPFENIIIVSQYFHITRTKMLFRKQGYKNLQGASPDYFEWRDLYAIPREFVAFYTTLLKSCF